MSEYNIGLMFQKIVKEHGNKVGMLVKKDGEWGKLTYREIGEYVSDFSLGLISLGLQAGDKVSLLSENRPKWAFTDLAVLSAGGTVATIYATNTSQQVAYIVSDSTSKFVVVSNHNQLEKVMSKISELPLVKNIIIFDPIEGITDKDSRVKSFKEVCDLGKKYENQKELSERINNIKEDDIVTLIYTSGTTGDPKGVMLMHKNIMSNVLAVGKLIEFKQDDLALSFLPLSHSFERMAGHFTMLYYKIPIAYAEGINQLADNMKEVKPTILVSVPRIFEKVHGGILSNMERSSDLQRKVFEWAIETGRQAASYSTQKKPLPALMKMKVAIADKLVYSKIKDRLGGNIRYMVSGGAPLAQEIAEFFYYLGLHILEGYGLTETSPVVSCNTPDNFKFGTVGQPIPGVKVKIADDGEILVKGDNVMKGYYNREEDTKEAIDEEFWFHTGDIGELDSENFLKITDRKKDLIITAGGKNVAPQNIENLLKMERFIEQVNVIGDRRKYLTAVIVPEFEEIKKWGTEKGITWESNTAMANDQRVVALVQECIDRVNSQLAKYETIKKFVLSEVQFTQENNMLTPTLKVKRKIVNKYFADKIEQMYVE